MVSYQLDRLAQQERYHAPDISAIAGSETRLSKWSTTTHSTFGDPGHGVVIDQANSLNHRAITSQAMALLEGVPQCKRGSRNIGKWIYRCIDVQPG